MGRDGSDGGDPAGAPRGQHTHQGHGETSATPELVYQHVNRKPDVWNAPPPPLQCISPGIVETEFAFRHHNSDPEKAAAVYESMKVSEQVRRSSGGFHMENVAEPPCVPPPPIHPPAVSESRRHSQRGHVCVERPPSRAGTWILPSAGVPGGKGSVRSD